MQKEELWKTGSWKASFICSCLWCDKATWRVLPAASHHSLTPSPAASLGFQFLKAPHLLALAMNSFSRGPSICQNAAVCVTSVKWLMQNLKQNSSKSWTYTTKIRTGRGLCLLTVNCFSENSPSQFSHPSQKRCLRPDSSHEASRRTASSQKTACHPLTRGKAWFP